MSKKENRKSYVKGLGLKSTLVSDSKVYLTTFADGSNAKLEKCVENNKIICISNDKEAFAASIANKNVGYKIKNDEKFRHPKGYDIISNNPLLHNNSVQQDMLGLKNVLEKRYFGKSSGGDNNLCIQIIHNIIDIEKILSEYIPNVVYAFNNIAGFKDEHNNIIDIIGTQTYNSSYTYADFSKDKSDKKYIEFQKLLKNKRLGYWGKAFFTGQGNNAKVRQENQCFHIIALLISLRNWATHSNELDKHTKRTWLYKLDDTNILNAEYVKTLNYLYDAIADELTKSFSKNGAVNVNYLAKKYNIKDDLPGFSEQYFRFSIMKEQKNLGFNISKLRENMLDFKDMSVIRDDHNRYDKDRSKIYTMMDFVIYRYYIDNNNDSIDFINKLRSSIDEKSKEKLYNEEANRLWNKLKEYMLYIKEFNGKLASRTPDRDGNISEFVESLPKIHRLLPRGQKISNFSKLMYLLTMFLDGKEINDLLTTLINKFENIQGFLDIMPEINVNAKFETEYVFFNKSHEIAGELKLIKGFAQMGEPAATLKLEMTADAIKILGTEKEDAELIKLAESLFKDENGELLGKKQHGMRNFIGNNVIKSKRFHYLIRYGDPAHLHKIATNKNVVRFVLGRIADMQKKQGQKGKNQIDRYYEVCVGNKDIKKTIKEKIDALTDIIVNMNYDQFEKKKAVIENQNRGKTFEEKNKYKRDNAEREKFKKIISLYLTVIYHILKNIVNVNSRYVLGFHCLERDKQLYIEKYNKNKLDGFVALTKFCLGDEERYEDLKAKAQASIQALETANPKLYAKYMNYSDEEKKEEFKKQLNRERVKNARNAYLKNIKNYIMIRLQLRDQTDSSGYLCGEFRDKVAHLEVARHAHEYIGNIKEVNSYFQLYHYIMQCRLYDVLKNNTKAEAMVKGKAKEYFEALEKEGTYNDKLLKIACVPFGYCIPRYKNLSMEELFDMNEEKKFKKKAPENTF